MVAVTPKAGTAARGALCLALVLPVCAAAQQGTPAPPAETTVTATAVIRGRVLSAANGAALIGAEVRMRGSAGRDTRLVTTDDQGQFEVRDLPSGEWTVMASKAGYVSQEFGQTSPFDSSTPVKLTNGQRLAMDVRLMRGSAVAGRVLNEYGDPVGDAAVQVMRLRTIRGIKQLVESGSGSRTDDLGAFRVYGLVPGDYYVIADVLSADNSFDGELTTARTYFPSATRLADAQLVRLRPGEDQLGLDVTAPSRASFATISGVVIGADGAPVTDAEVSVVDRDINTIGGARRSFSRVDRNGRFLLTRIPPGSYDLEAEAFRASAGTEAGTLQVEVDTADVSGLTVALSVRPRVRVTGTIVTETGAPPPPGVELTLRTEVEGIRGAPSLTTTLSRDNGRFTLELLAGTTFGVDLATPGWMVKRIEINGRESADGTLDVAPGVTTAAVRVVLTDRVAEVSGTVSLGGAARAGVVIFPADASKWTYPSPYVKSTRTDANGRFTLSGLPVERYHIVAVSYLEEFEFHDPEFLKQMIKSATDVRLAEGERRAVVLPLTKR
jgi:hypothetical protein